MNIKKYHYFPKKIIILQKNYKNLVLFYAIPVFSSIFWLIFLQQKFQKNNIFKAKASKI